MYPYFIVEEYVHYILHLYTKYTKIQYLWYKSGDACGINVCHHSGGGSGGNGAGVGVGIGVGVGADSGASDAGGGAGDGCGTIMVIFAV